MSDGAILCASQGPIATITLNRPSALNALSSDLRTQLVEAVERAEHDDSARVVVIRGAGSRAFSAGADVKEFVPTESLIGTRALRHAGNWNDVVAACSKPTLALIDGYCLGGGVELALACDFRIATTQSIFGFPEVGLGLIPGAGGTQRLPRLIGAARAMDLILSGRRIDADEALGMGLVSDVVPSARLTEAGSERADTLAKVAPVAYTYAKEAIIRGMGLSLDDGLRLEADLATVLTNSDDRQEGVRAFRERRNASYTGS